MRYFLLGFLVIQIAACSQKKKGQVTINASEPVVQMDTVLAIKEVKPQLKSLEGIADTTFVRLADFSNDFVYDMRYATENNFLKEKVYDCAQCYVNEGV